MKKNIILLMLLATAMVARAFDFSALTTANQRLYYTITSSSTVSLVAPSDYDDWEGYDKPTGELTLPSSVTHEGTPYTVTAVDDKAFLDCKRITSLHVPSSIATIGARAFANDTSLTEVTIDEGLASIARMAFSQCKNLATIHLPATLTSIGMQAFQGTAYYNNDANWSPVLTLVLDGWLLQTANTVSGDIVISDNIVGIANHAFYYCRYLEGVTLPATLRRIGQSAFLECSQLDSVRLEATVPPVLDVDAFVGFQGSVVVPCGTVATYSAADGWSGMNLVEAACPPPTESVEMAEEMAQVAVVVNEKGLLVLNAAGETLTVYDLMGRAVATVASASDRQTIALPKHGIYLLRHSEGSKTVLYR